MSRKYLLPLDKTSAERGTVPFFSPGTEKGDSPRRFVRWHLLLVGLCALTLSGCRIFPEVAHQPVLHNPYPQLAKIAVAPFFNLSTEPTLDGRQLALAYFNELQLVQGFEVVPVGVVEKTMETYRIGLSGAEDARKLAQVLGVDAVVIGAVTDFSPYYPPRCSMQVEWYAANPGFHSIPPGYGLPWGTPEEEFIPAPLVLESEFALAKAQLKTQTPAYAPPVVLRPQQPEEIPTPKAIDDDNKQSAALMSHHEPAPGAIDTSGATVANLPPNWPDARSFVPPPPQAQPPQAIPTNEPVMKHVAAYNGQDAEFTAALESYVFFQNDGRAGNWQAYLQRSDDFIRFCCHMHIFEMLSARGGAGETRVVWRWSKDR